MIDQDPALQLDALAGAALLQVRTQKDKETYKREAKHFYDDCGQHEKGSGQIASPRLASNRICRSV